MSRRYIFDIDLRPPRWWRREWKAVARLVRIEGPGALEQMGFRGPTVVTYGESPLFATNAARDACQRAVAKMRDRDRVAAEQRQPEIVVEVGS